MKYSPTYRSTKRGGFSLIELLVAIAVLSLIVIVMAQVLQAASLAWFNGQARVNNFVKGRAMMDLVARDLQAGIYRDDLSAFPTNQISFYTERPGFSGSAAATRSVSWVTYAASNTTLQRGDMAVEWGAANLPSFDPTNALPPVGTITSRDTASGVVGFKVLFLYGDGTISENYSTAKRPKAFGVGLAVIDDNMMNRLSAAQIAQIKNDFSNSASGTNSIKADWDKMLSGLNWGAYPGGLGSGLKIFERYVAAP